MKHLSEQQLNDYLDGLLSNAEQASLDAHLAVCAECRTELDALRSTLADLHALPAGVKPASCTLAFASRSRSVLISITVTASSEREAYVWTVWLLEEAGTSRSPM